MLLGFLPRFSLSCTPIQLIVHIQEPKMKHLYRLQHLLVGSLLLLLLPLASSQVGEPLVVNVRNSGSSFTDQFPAPDGYTSAVLVPPSPQLGTAGIAQGGSTNTLLFTFTPNIGAKGSTDVVIKYYTLSAPMHPVTKSYRFYISDEVVIAGNDQYLVEMNGTDVPLQVLDNDSVSNGNLTLTTVAVSNGGEAIINAEGDAVLYTPTVDFTGDAWIQYIACDSAGNCGEGKVHVLVDDSGNQQNVVFQKFLLNQEKLEVLTPGDNFEVNNDPAHGTLESKNAITWVYTPEAGFVGKDTIELSLSGAQIRKYVITVYSKPVNVQAVDDRFYVRPGQSVTFNVLNNDLIDEFNITGHTNPSKGVLSESGNGGFTYSPISGFRGVDKFTYTVCYQDTVFCETATVLVHVTDLEPDNQFAYSLQTSKDLPLTIDYPIAYTDFSYIINNEPDHGTLTFNEGVQEFNLPCESIESYNLLVYTPNAGYTGPDYFEYLYCMPNNLCYKVKVNMNVVEASEDESCACIVDCVWPGDGDLDGRVDMNDLLALGYRLGTTGPSRNYGNPSSWFGQHADEWPSSGIGKGIQYLDGNGDGAITSADVEVIDQHYYRVHDIVTRDVQQRLPYQFSIIPVQYSLDSGDVVILDISFGTAAIPVIGMKGAKFSINVPPLMLDSSSVEVNFHQDSWLAEGSPNVSLGKVPWDGRIDAGFAKANGDAASGFGVLSTVVFIIENDVEGFKSDDGLIHLPIRLEGGVAMDANGVLYDIDDTETILTIDPPNKDNSNPYNLIVYPNPAQDLVNVHLNGKTSIRNITLVDTQGRQLRTISNVDSKHTEIGIGDLPMGLYYLQVEHEFGVMTQLLSVIR